MDHRPASFNDCWKCLFFKTLRKYIGSNEILHNFLQQKKKATKGSIRIRTVAYTFVKIHIMMQIF